MVLTDVQIAAFIQQYFLPFVRIGALFMTMPVFGTPLVPARVRILAAFVITLVVVPLLPPMAVTPGLSLATWLVVIQEIFIGAAAGFSFQIVFQVFVLAGQFMAMKMGLGFAAMNDPVSGVQTTALSQFYLLLVTLMFIAVNGHLILIELLVGSFYTLPPGGFQFSAEQAINLVRLGSWLFASALVMSLPVLTAILIINIAFGVMSRAAPQLNIFAIGFPFTLICGMVLVWIGLSTLPLTFEQVMADGFAYMHQLLRVR